MIGNKGIFSSCLVSPAPGTIYFSWGKTGNFSQQQNGKHQNAVSMPVFYDFQLLALCAMLSLKGKHRRKNFPKRYLAMGRTTTDEY